MCTHKSTFPVFQLENMQWLMREPMWAVGRERGGNIATALGTLHALGLGSGWLNGCAGKSQSTCWDGDTCLRPSPRFLTSCCSLLVPAPSPQTHTGVVPLSSHLCLQDQLRSAPLGLVLPTVLLLLNTGNAGHWNTQEQAALRCTFCSLGGAAQSLSVPNTNSHLVLFWGLCFHLRGESVFDHLIIPVDSFHSAFEDFTYLQLCRLLLPAARGQPEWTSSYVKCIAWGHVGMWRPLP